MHSFIRGWRMDVRYVDAELAKDEEFLLEAIARSTLAMRYVPHELQVRRCSNLGTAAAPF